MGTNTSQTEFFGALAIPIPIRKAAGSTIAIGSGNMTRSPMFLPEAVMVLSNSAARAVQALMDTMLMA
jgi:hypothetical protein